MLGEDPTLKLIERDLRYALAVELFVEFGFVVAMLALAGTFNGGQPTTTPPIAAAYIYVGFIVTIAVIVRTFQMLSAVRRRDLDAVRRMRARTWAWVALVFSAILPSFFLIDAASLLERRS